MSAESPGAPDLRLPVLAALAWSAALVGVLVPARVVGYLALGAIAILLVVGGRLVPRRRRQLGGPMLLAWCAVLLAVGAGAILRAGVVHGGPVPRLAAQHAAATVQGRVLAEPLLREGRFGDYTLTRVRLSEVATRERRWRSLASPVLVLGPATWRTQRRGAEIRFDGVLGRASSHDLAAVVQVRAPPRTVHRPSPPLRAAERVREGVRTAAGSSTRGAGAAEGLLPALVDGEESGVPQEVRDDFQTAGLTHLLAVSGTNLTLVVGALLLVARRVGVQARGLAVVGGLGVVGFVLVAGPEPSVLRAAAMGTAALIGLGSNGRERGLRAWGAAVLGLLLLDPWLAIDLGFALSAAATVGILLLAPGWRDRAGRWMPRWAAEAVAVPLAAQLACTPLVAAISGQVSLVAVPANLLAAPVVGPATVLGLGGGLLSAVWAPLGRPLGIVGTWCCAWLIWVADRCAAMPTAAIGWSLTAVSIAVLSVVCLVAAVLLGPLLARRWASLAVAVAVSLVIAVGVPTPGWPPPRWVLVACDVGQGDGLVLAAGDDAAVVVDTGPDPRLMDRCLRRLGIRRIALVLLTHFHADHVDGLSGVLAHRQVGAIEVTGLAEPASGAREVREIAERAGVPIRVGGAGERARIGDLSWQTLAPASAPPPESDSPPNDASLVLLVRSHGLSLLLMGDEETDTQQLLARRLEGVHIDVLKVAHHGSAKQDPDLVRGLRPRLAVISVGADNDYGHPAGRTLALLRSAGAVVHRTDRDGDIAVVAGPGGLRVATSGVGRP